MGSAPKVSRAEAKRLAREADQMEAWEAEKRRRAAARTPEEVVADATGAVMAEQSARIESLAREVQVLRDRLTISEARAEAAEKAEAVAVEVASLDRAHHREIAEARDKLALAEAREVELRGAASFFLDTAEGAIRAFENRDTGGMRVPYRGDFANIPPSVVGQLRWWANRFRAALAYPEVSRG